MTKTLELVEKAQDIMESFDPSPAMTIGYDEPTYTLTAEQMSIIAGALYRAYCDLCENEIKSTTSNSAI